MNKFYVYVSSILLVFSALAKADGGSSSASATGRSSVAIGIEGGVSFENASTPADISSSTQTGFMAGVNTTWAITNNFLITPELLYVQRGTNLVDGSGLHVNLHSDSLEIPVLFKARFGEKIAPYIFAGPVAIVNLTNSVQASNAQGQAVGVSYNPRTIDFAADLGVGVEFGPFFANLRYSLGLLDVNYNQASWQSRGFQLLAGINI